MWKDLSEHKPNIWQQSILQTTGPLCLLGMRKHQGRLLHFHQFPGPQKEKINWKKLFQIPHKGLLPSHSKLPLLILRKAFSKKPFFFPDYLHYLQKDKNESWIRYHQSLPYTHSEINVSPIMVIVSSYFFHPPPHLIPITIKLQPGVFSGGFEEATDLPFPKAPGWQQESMANLTGWLWW